MTECRHQNDVRISWVNDERADLAGVLQADILPSFPAIDRFEDSRSVRRVTADGRLPGAGVDHIVIGWRDCDRANRRNRFLIK